jgi:hypothetical protein
MGASESPPKDLITPLDSPDLVSDLHLHGHLVYTGIRVHKDESQHEDQHEVKLFIHKAQKAIQDHYCYVYSRAKGKTIVKGPSVEPSADIWVEEHGWFRDLAVLRQICHDHTVPDAQNQQSIFFSWRDSLLTFLDTHHSGGLWTRSN